jgi:AhpD family alkylhydroperoxidase
VIDMTFPERHAHLRELVAELGREAPGPMSGFARLHASSVTDGELEPKVKELMALAIAIAIRCEDCIAYHVHDAVAAGASRQEIVETIGVAVMMGGGPAAVCGAQALEAAGEFAAAR